MSAVLTWSMVPVVADQPNCVTSNDEPCATYAINGTLFRLAHADHKPNKNIYRTKHFMIYFYGTLIEMQKQNYTVVKTLFL